MSLARQYSNTSQRHLTVTTIRDRMGWSDPSCRGFWQDLRDSAQDFRVQHFIDAKWGDIDDAEKARYCRMFTLNSRHRELIQREELKEGTCFISWWLLANTRPIPSTIKPPPPTILPATSRSYYDPVRG